MATYNYNGNSIKNQELSLHHQHLEDLRKSGLFDETILRADIKSVPPAEIKKLLGFEPQKLISAYIIPYQNTKGFFRLRCFYEDGYSGAKYLQKKESGSHIYIPPDLDVSALRNSEIPLYITEGEKKALKAYQEGLPCIAISGLWNWSNGKGELITDFDQIELKSRTIFLVPDNDFTKQNKHGYKKNLEQALQRLALKLIERGAEVYLVELPQSDEKVGLDDFLCKYSLEKFKELPIKQIVLNAENYKKAIHILKSGDVLSFIISELSKNYVLRQKELNLCYLACLLPKLGENYTVIVTGESAVGKSSLVSTVFKSIPEAFKLVFHSASSKALLYRNKDLSKTVLWINELSGASEIIELLKGLMTEKQASHGTVNDSKIGKKYQQLSIKADGLTCFITSTRETFPEELANRAFILNLKANAEIIEAITRLQAEKANGNIIESCDYELLKEIYKNVKPYQVKIPFAKEIQKHLDKSKTRITRDFQKILALIKAHALLNQHQREIKHGKIIANEEDYKAIYEISDLVIESFSELRTHHVEFLKACEDWITRADIARLLGKTEKTILNYCKELKDFIEIEGKGSEQKIKSVYIPENQKPLPHPNIIFPFPNFPNSNSLENSNTYTGNCEISDNFRFSQNQSEDPKNGKTGNFGKNGNFPSNSLKYKEKMQIGKSETENYIYDEFWLRANFDDIEILDE
ncbi:MULTISPECIES: DUF3854 domain-containing protein [Thermodesulfovibrio]|uniref:DUF3854 domain-containing protein n=1 Tax=Thermodesulfovibrio TaxID=28261 RepID=UPI00261CEB48|nr:DUF3854 domain-containing protein [Thermodesulfovibrio sp.]